MPLHQWRLVAASAKRQDPRHHPSAYTTKDWPSLVGGAERTDSLVLVIRGVFLLVCALHSLYTTIYEGSTEMSRSHFFILVHTFFASLSNDQSINSGSYDTCHQSHTSPSFLAIHSDQDEPTYVDALRGVGVRQIACGSGHTVVLTVDGEVYTWGRGGDGRLGHGDNGWKVRRLVQTEGIIVQWCPSCMRSYVRVWSIGLDRFAH